MQAIDCSIIPGKAGIYGFQSYRVLASLEWRLPATEILLLSAAGVSLGSAQWLALRFLRGVIVAFGGRIAIVYQMLALLQVAVTHK